MIIKKDSLYRKFPNSLNLEISAWLKCYNYVFVNTVLWSGGVIDWFFLDSLLLLFGSVLFKQILLLSLVSSKNVFKPYINPGERPFNLLKEVGYIVQITCIDFLSLQLLLQMVYPHESFTYELLTFLPRSFAFELVFDLGHYVTHRIAHNIPWIYQSIHKEHHKDILISPLTTYHQNGVDLLFTNTLPLLLASYMIPTSSLFVCVMMWYKTILEVGGHLGKVTKANSFPQCIWLPRWLKIELKSEEHNLHHRNPMRNFSKRFSIWDKAFGTFEAYCVEKEE
jgi:sterol desaturase/sphingolipid hydroxylase (fatty acid hydroxylase superfamily)